VRGQRSSLTSRTTRHLRRVPTHNALEHSRVLNMTGSSPEDSEFDESDDAAWQAIVDELGPLTLPPADSKSTQTSPDTDESASDVPARASSSWRGPDDTQRSLAEIFNDDHLGLEQDDDESLEDGFTPPDPGLILDGD